MASLVKDSTGTLIPLINPKGYSVRVCGQDDTVYRGNKDQLEAWKDFYLPERTEMVVIGAVDDFPCDAFGLQLVLLLCEDGKVYTYEDEVLHLVARNVKELLDNGLTFPGLESYKEGECFEDYVSLYSFPIKCLVTCTGVKPFICRIFTVPCFVFQTEEEYKEIMESDEMREITEAHERYRKSLEHDLLESLKAIKTDQMKVNFSAIKNGEKKNTQFVLFLDSTAVQILSNYFHKFLVLIFQGVEDARPKNNSWKNLYRVQNAPSVKTLLSIR